MPHVIPADAEKFFPFTRLLNRKLSYQQHTERDNVICYQFLNLQVKQWRLSVKTAAEKPRFIIVGLQTAKDGDQTKNPSTFDHLNIKNAYITLNSDRYPAVDYNLSFANQKFSRVYGDAALFGVKFFGMDELITQSNITPSDYKTLYPLFMFDVSKQKEKLKSSVVDIQIKANFTENVPTNTRACCHSNLTITKCM